MGCGTILKVDLGTSSYCISEWRDITLAEEDIIIAASLYKHGMVP